MEINDASSPSGLTAAIRQEARRLGFFKVGVAQARPLPRAERLDSWLAAGMHGEMAYMARQAARRKNPDAVLEGARSVVVVAMNYCTDAFPAGIPLSGIISRYARGDDYHDVIEAGLRELLGFIRRERPEAAGAHYVDTGPVMEKVWGAESSLGWMGKHGNLVTRERGSWFFLGVILLNLPLEYDLPARDHCGTCRRCISACPTGAIVAPYVVDARLCVSYLTIEHRGPIPRRLRPLLGARLFGCDDCQEACPWNRFAVPSQEDRLQPRPENLALDLIVLGAMTQGEFDARFRGSSVRRARRDGFVRNVVLALGNSRSAAAIPALEQALKDPSPLVRGHAAWALGQIPGEAAVSVLRQCRCREQNAEVIEEYDLALSDRFRPAGEGT